MRWSDGAEGVDRTARRPKSCRVVTGKLNRYHSTSHWRLEPHMHSRAAVRIHCRIHRGGVFGVGTMQEEIMFVTSPELCVACGLAREEGSGRRRVGLLHSHSVAA